MTEARTGCHRLALCVYCASSDHLAPVYRDMAAELGREMARRNIALVYGGGNNGLMGVLAESMHAAGGSIIGVIPRALHDRGLAYDSIDELVVTEDLRRRKAEMERRADGFLGLPGGFGTFEELLEVVTLRQLKLLDKPIAILNTAGYFAGLLEQHEHAIREGFIGEESRALYRVVSTVNEALDYLIAR